MHAIRSAARQSAWKYYDDGGRNYNPFARTARGPGRRSDDEEALKATRTADSVPSRLEQDRLDKSRQDYSHPHRSGTAPPTSAVNEHPPRNVLPETIDEKAGQAEASSPTSFENGTLPGSASTNKELSPDNSYNESRSTDTTGAQKPRKRGLAQKLHLRKDKTDFDHEQDLEKKKNRPKSKNTGFYPQLKATLFGSWINVLLITVPVGFAINYAHLNGVANFVVNFIAIIPLAAMLSFATEELAMYTGETLGGLLNASFGNATELIVSVIALSQKKILIVQTSLIGSMLSNLLLVLGMCFFFGGFNRVKQHFNITVAQTASSLLALSIGSLIIPTAFQRFGTSTDSVTTQAGVAPISRGTAIILLFVYASYLLFQLKTHNDMYNEPSKKVEKRKTAKKEKGETMLGMARMGAGSAATAGGHVNQSNLVQEEEDEEEAPALTVIGALLTLLISTVAIAFCSEFMVSGIDTIAESISEEFIGLILIPIVGNAAEHATAVTVAIKDKMDLSIGVAVGSSMQIALLVLPLMVVIGWCGVGQPGPAMTLDFDGFQVTVLFIAVLLVNYLIQDGESHWLEGVLLMATYIIIAVSAWFYPVAGDVVG